MGKAVSKKQLNYERNQRKKLANKLKKASIEEAVDILAKKSSKGNNNLHKLQQEISGKNIKNHQKDEEKRDLKEDLEQGKDKAIVSNIDKYDSNDKYERIDSAQLIFHRNQSRKNFYQSEDENPSITPPAEIHKDLDKKIELEENKNKRSTKRFSLTFAEVIESYQSDIRDLKFNQVRPNEKLDELKEAENKNIQKSEEDDKDDSEINEDLGDIDEYEVDGVIAKRYSGNNTQLLLKWSYYEYWESSWVKFADCSDNVKKMANAKEMKEFRLNYDRAIKDKPEKNVLGSKGAIKAELFNLAKSIIDEFD